MRRLVSSGRSTPALFREALTSVPPAQRDPWLDLVFGLEEVLEDGPELPRGCVPYLPCPVDALLRAVDHAGVHSSDVFVDIGSGLGRAALLAHLLTGAASIGLEIQPALVRASRDLARRLGVSRSSAVEGDAVGLAGHIAIGSVFFFYCPFSGDRLEKVLTDLEAIARTRPIRICCVDLPLPPRPWLTLVSCSGDLVVYRSNFPDVRASAEEG
jgi:SAM-dependent methyltransferase